MVECEPNLPDLPIFGLFGYKFDQFLTYSTKFQSNSKIDSNSDRDFESDSLRRVFGPLEANRKVD